ncbi:MAG: trypsin-like peptidase domain-containing protein, partial [Firmicutes bacterium]|nr:trypsin-like peptidase domain-containing protein [Bacillota bacterium]
MDYHWREDRGRTGGLFLAALAGAIIGGLLVGAMLLAFLPGSLGPARSRNPAAEVVPSPAPAPDAGPNSVPLPGAGTYSVAAAAQRVGPAVVKIATKQEEVVYSFFFRPMVREREGLGSGVIIDSAGHILTNYHVIEDVTQITVVLADGRQFSGRIVGADAYTDLAVIKISDSNLPVAELGDSGAITVGEPAIAIGNPYGFDHTVTAGVISALNRSIDPGDRSGVVLEGLIQTDAPINPGNSGGALVSAAGQVIGINTAIIAQAQSIGFAIPINTARDVAREIIAYGKVRRPYVGVAEIIPVTRDIAARYNLPVTEGVYISTV